jgi:hypothetical protein
MAAGRHESQLQSRGWVVFHRLVPRIGRGQFCSTIKQRSYD